MFLLHYLDIMGVMKMGNIVPRVVIEPTSSGILRQCATISPYRVPDVTIIPTSTYLFSSLP